MKSDKHLIETLLAQADITINGNNPWDIQVRNDRFYPRIIREKNLGLGESYMDGWWDCEKPDEMVYRLLRGGIEEKVRGNLLYLVRFLPGILFNRQSRSRARMVAEHHYNLDNDLFLSFLDPHNQYSCGYFLDTEDLSEAQQKKLDLILQKLNLSSSDHLLDIGCGWGGLARFAAERIGCRVTAINVSQSQLGYAAKTCRHLPVYFEDRDYRTITGRYDKIVSVGMFEHVGPKNYRTFMQTVSRCLTDTGVFLLHTIGGNTSQAACDPWIATYIFPNGVLPSMAQITQAVEGLFVVEDWHNLGPHYDKTLIAWHRNFQKAWSWLKDRYDVRFKRMWEYYLLSCAGAFRARDLQVWQIVMTRFGFGTPQPVCRFGDSVTNGQAKCSE